MSISRRHVLALVGAAIGGITAGCTSHSTYRTQVQDFNRDLDSLIFERVESEGSASSDPTLQVDVSETRVPARCELRRPDGEVVSVTTVYDDTADGMTHSSVRRAELTFEGEGPYALYGEGKDGVGDSVHFYVEFHRTFGVGRWVGLLSHRDASEE